MKTKFIALMLVIILISSNIAFAQIFNPNIQTQNQDLFGRDLAGDAIFVEVAGYEPTIVPASVLNDQEVPVYIYLRGTTLGGLTLDTESSQSAPFYGLPDIKDIQIRPKGTGASYLTGGYRYIKPIRNEITSDNRFYDLGYLIMNIRKIDNENEIPDMIDADFTARIEFELENSFGNFGAQDLVLKESPDENKWKESPDGSFWGRTGFVRVNKIDGDKVSLQVYDGYGGSFRSLSLGSITLSKKDDISNPLRISGITSLFNDQFRIRLNDIVDDKDKARIRILRNGEVEYKWVFEGQPIYYGSKWVVKDIKKGIGSDGSVYEKVELEDKDGNIKDLYRRYNEEGLAEKFDGSISWRHNNPLNIKYGDFAKKYGATEGEEAIDDNDESHYALFPSEEVGLKAAKDLLSGSSYKDLLLDAAMKKWSNNGYGKEVALEFSDKKIKDLSDSELNTLIDKMKTKEGWIEGTFKEDSKEEKENGDICSNINSIDISGINENTDSTAVLCKAIHEFNKYLNDYGEDTNRDEIYYYLGLSHEQLGDLSDARKYLQQINADSKYYGLAAEKLEDIDDEENKNLEEIPLYLDEENVQLILKEIQLAEGEGTKIIVKTTFGDKVLENSYSIGDKLEYDNKVESLWYIKSADINHITLAAKFTGEDKEREQRLVLGRSESFSINNDNRFIASLENVERDREAYLTILPGSGRAISETEFSVHIPIENYGIKFSDEQIDAQINWTQKAIGTLTGVINKLDNIIQFGNYICWGFWSAFTLKNLFTPDLNKARRLVMNGLDGESGVKKICTDKVGFNKEKYPYSSYDECVFANRDKINSLIEASKSSLESSKSISLDKDYINKYKYEDFEIVTENELREYKRLELLNTKLQSIQGDEFTNSFKNQVKKVYDDESDKLENYDKAIISANNAVEKYSGEDSFKQRQLWKQIYNSELSNTQEEVSIPSSIPYEALMVYSDKKDKFYTFRVNTDDEGKVDSSEEVELFKLKIGDYIKKLEPLSKSSSGDEKKLIDSEISRLSDLNQNSQAVTWNGFYLFKDSSGKMISSGTTVEGIRTTYADNADMDIYSNGRPYRLPIGDGDFVEVLEYYAVGSPKAIELWNVGNDGYLGTSDDVLLKSNNDLMRQENTNENNRLREEVSRAGVCEEGGSRTVKGINKKFLCKTEKSQLEKQLSSKQCTDVFSIGECQVLFNFCDPVMCPASRFNLGGKYQVDNVVQTGLIGSLTLGMPNWVVFSKSAQYIPPVCLTGVSSSAKAYRSMLEGYNECLKVSKEKGENVGICEKIRSVFWCELAWREGSEIAKAVANIKNTKDVYDYLGSSGGGEYTALQQIASDTSDSVNFFTQEYAKNAFAAYKARSTNEIGSTICKAFIGVKGPELGKFFDELTRPESPPQFTAYFDEKAWSSEAGITSLNRQSGLGNVEEQSLYNVYYHIYAGEDQDARYTVFLRDDFGNVAYVTDRIGGYNGFIQAGGYADRNIDFIGQSGFKEICVVINGQFECGFGKASTSFGLNRLSDALVKSDSERQITSAEECTPEYNGPSTSLGGVPIVLPTNVPGVTTQNGIVRLCSINNPGTGVNIQDYDPVGTCGTDNLGRNLGTCWIDLRTVSRAIKSTDFKEDISERYGEELTINDELAKKIFDKNEELFKNYFLLTGEEVDYLKGNFREDIFVLNELTEIQHERTTLKDGDGYIGSYRDLSNYNFGNYGKLSQIRIGQVYYALGKYLRDKEVEKSNEIKKEDIEETIKISEENIISKVTLSSNEISKSTEKLAINFFLNEKFLGEEVKKDVNEIFKSDYLKNINLKIYDVNGKLVYESDKPSWVSPSYYFYIYDKYSNDNPKWSSGVYLYKFTAKDKNENDIIENGKFSLIFSVDELLYEIVLEISDNSLLSFGWIPGIDKFKEERIAWDGNDWFIFEDNSYRIVNENNRQFKLGDRNIDLYNTPEELRHSVLEELGVYCTTQRNVCSEIEFNCLKNEQIKSNIITSNFVGDIRTWIFNMETGCLLS
jgi:hypothetical protein